MKPWWRRLPLVSLAVLVLAVETLYYLALAGPVAVPVFHLTAR